MSKTPEQIAGKALKGCDCEASLSLGWVCLACVAAAIKEAQAEARRDAYELADAILGYFQRDCDCEHSPCRGDCIPSLAVKVKAEPGDSARAKEGT